MLLLPRRVLSHTQISFNVFVFLWFNALFAFAGGDPFLDLLDPVLPYCDIPKAFDSSHQTFVEIKNNLPGRSAYNNMILDYQRRQWPKLDSKIEKFRIEFESSPLREAVEFLAFQAELERLNSEDPDSLKHTEQHFRELLLLYPKSSLTSTVQVSLANFYLKNGNAQKSLGLFRELRRDFPFHPDQCHFMFGEAEAEYQLNGLVDSKRTYQAILQKCQSKKIKLGSEIRLLDIAGKENPKENQVNSYEALRQKETALIQRFFPDLILNLGEAAYRGREYEQSLFYLNEFKRSVSGRHACEMKMLKRLADITMRKEKAASQILGKYLEVYELDPKSDLGKFSKVIALGYQGEEILKGEFERRDRTIKELIPQIQDKNFNLRARVLDSVVRLKRKKQESLEAINSLYLLKNANPQFFRGELEAQIRKEIIQLQEQKPQMFSQLSPGAWDKWFWETTLRTHAEWFKGSTQEDLFKQTVSAQTLERAQRQLENGRNDDMVRNLRFWSETELFTVSLQDLKQKEELVGAILVSWMEQAQADQKKTSELISENESYLKKIFGAEGQTLWVKVALEKNKEKDLENALRPLRVPRKIAAVGQLKNEKVLSVKSLVLGQAFRRVNQISLSNKYLALVKSPEFKNMSVLEQMRNARDQKRFKTALQLGFSQLKLSSEKERMGYLEVMSDAVKSGKLWPLANRLYQISKDLKLESSEKALVLGVLGRAKFEEKQFKEASSLLNEALVLDPEGRNTAEASFFLARSLSKSGDLNQAKQVLSQLKDKKDEFWSPLAETEMEILGEP